ncbi:MAG: tetratricopeptide repeat protein [Acidobacteriota bacterium]|nr:tetratricopeptide repeat protein [Acidobacteriota bacterium]
MLKRTIIVLSITITLAFVLEPLQPVKSMLMTDAEVAMINSSYSIGQQNRGNAFVRVLKAPFKAIGRLFGRGRKDDNKLHRLSEKDVERFEKANVTRILDAQSAPATTSDAATSISPVETMDQVLGDRKAVALQHVERGRLLLESGNVNEAIGALSLAISYDPKLRDAHNLLGVAYGIKGLRNLALDSFEASLKGDNDNPEHLNNLGYFLYQNGEYEDATKYLKKSVKRDPKNERFWNNLGLAQAQRGKFDDAYKSFARAMGEFDGRLNVATRLQRLGQDKDAIKHLERARELRPNSEETLSRLITLYERTGKNAHAWEARMSLVSLRATAKAPTE